MTNIVKYFRNNRRIHWSSFTAILIVVVMTGACFGVQQSSEPDARTGAPERLRIDRRQGQGDPVLLLRLRPQRQLGGQEPLGCRQARTDRDRRAPCGAQAN